jgi:ADP-ribose pyrophosphatase
MSIIRKRNESERMIIPNGKPEIIARGKLGAIVGFPMLVEQGEGYVEKVFERFVRPPGTRIIAIENKKIYLQKEHRLESNNEFDWRLPGGKVFDRFEEYEKYIGEQIPEEIILSAGKKELLEEAKMVTEKISIYKKSTCGASVEWDLYYLFCENTKNVNHTHHETEEIVDGKYFTFDEVKTMCLFGEIDEDRTVAILLKFINEKQS